MTSRYRSIGLVGALFLFASAARAQVGANFSAGRTRFSLNAAYTSLNGHDYTVVGAGAGYYFFDGFEAGVDGQAWMGDRPHLYSVSPEARYVMTMTPSFKPYLGGFYKRTFYDVLTNRDSVGGRAGFISPLGEHVYASAGVVYEKMFNCDPSLYSSCSQVYPELGISISY